MKWFRVLAGLLGAINEGTLGRNEYLLEENRILRKRIPGAIKLDDAERVRLAELAKKLGAEGAEGDRHHRPAGVGQNRLCKGKVG